MILWKIVLSILSPEVVLVQEGDTARLVHLVTAVVHVAILWIWQHPTPRVARVVEVVAVEGGWQRRTKCFKRRINTTVSGKSSTNNNNNYNNNNNKHNDNDDDDNNNNNPLHWLYRISMVFQKKGSAGCDEPVHFII